jgi:hypothetical protein
MTVPYPHWSRTPPVDPGLARRGHPGWPRKRCRHLRAAQEGPPRRFSGPSSMALDLQSPFFEARLVGVPSAYVINRPKTEAAPSPMELHSLRQPLSTQHLCSSSSRSGRQQVLRKRGTGPCILPPSSPPRLSPQTRNGEARDLSTHPPLSFFHHHPAVGLPSINRNSSLSLSRPLHWNPFRVSTEHTRTTTPRSLET